MNRNRSDKNVGSEHERTKKEYTELECQQNHIVLNENWNHIGYVKALKTDASSWWNEGIQKNEMKHIGKCEWIPNSICLRIRHVNIFHKQT